MTHIIAAVAAAFQFPESGRVDQRVPKKLLLENGAPTVSDKHLITDAIEHIQWLSVLKPNTIGVPEYRDTEREYLEISVLAVTLREDIKPVSLSRLMELIHRAVPYPVLLLLEIACLNEGRAKETALTLSLVHKRLAQNETGKVVLDGDLLSATLIQASDGTDGADAKLAFEIERDFLQSLAITLQPQTSMKALYQGWIECVQALHAARQTGKYRVAETPAQAAARQQALADCWRLEGEIGRLRVEAGKETQLARQVELNLSLRRIQAELASARVKL